MQKFYKKLLTLILSISIVLSCLPITAFAAENPEEENKIISEAVDETEATIVTEVVDERTADKKVFLLSDGSYLAAFYPHHVHFEENGAWQDIDNTLVSGLSDEDVVENKNSNFKIKFSNKAKDEKLVSIKKENYKIDWALSGSKKVRVETISSDSQSNSPTTLKNLYGTAIYKDILSDTDLKYTVTPLKIKEDIIIKSANAPESFTFNYEFKNLSHRITQENAVELYDENSGETVFLMDAPFMYDAAGVYSGDIELKISETDKGIELVIIPDSEWMNDKERVFPVVIDPTMPLDYNYQNTKDATVSFKTRANTIGASSLVSSDEKAYLKVGRRYTDELGVVIYHDVHNQLPKGVNIVNAQLSFLSYRGGLSTCGSNLQINAYEILSDWGQTTISSNMVLFSGENPGTPSHSSTVLDYIIYNDASSSADSKWYTFDITKAVQKWQNGQSTNRGIMLRATGLGSSEQFARFYDSDHGLTGTDPAILVTYRDAVGLENYWSYISHSIGEKDAGHVNLYNGNLVYVHNIAAFNSEINGFNLSLICNSLEANSNWAYCGNGWKLNLIQTFKTVTIKNNSYVKFVYTDADGTEHYFVQNSDGTIVDEDGLGLTYSNNSGVDSTLPHKITDKDKNAYYFDSKGYLRKIVDSNNNYISFTYTDINTTDAKLTSVTTSSGGLITLQYNSDNLLYRIIDNAQRTTEINYVGTNLASIKYPDGRTTGFHYSSNRMTGVVLSDNSEMCYEYDSTSGRVEKIWNKSKNSTTGNVLTFEYEYNQTKVTDSNDKKITYQFDTFGRPVCVYDDNQNIYSQTYTQSVQTGSGIFANNKLATSSNGAVYVNNLIIDPTFSKERSHWTHYSNSSLSTCSIVTTNSLLSSNSMLLTTGENKHSCIIQTVSTGAGKTYTLSAYMKLVDVTSNGYGAGLEVRTSTNRLLHTFKTGTTDTTIDNGFEKVTLTVTLQEGETITTVGAGLYNALGSVYVDSVQLEEGDTANTINLLSNSSFETNSGNGTIPTGYVKSDTVYGCDNTETLTYGNSYTVKIDGNVNSNAAVYQTVNVSGKAGDVYSFGGWAKADSVPPHSTGNVATFDITIMVYNADGTIEWITSKFNIHVSDWQFTQSAFVAKKDYTKFVFHAIYKYNCNTAYFDNLFLYRDTMQSYTYDSNGNAVSSADYASQNSQYNYSDNNLSRLISPTGSGYEYMYDAKGNLGISRSSEGLQYNFYYDSQGNATSAVIRKNNYSESLQTGKSYYIRLKRRGKYLTVSGASTSESANVVVEPFSGTQNQMWTLEATGDGAYYLIPAHCTTKCLNVTGSSNAQNTNVDIYTKNSSSAQKFVITPYYDYAYTLIPKSSSDNKLLTVNHSGTLNNVSIITKQGDYNPDQEWYFEPVENEPVNALEDDGIYLFRGRQSGKYMNSQYMSTNGLTPVSQSFLGYSTNFIYFAEKWENTEFFTLTPLMLPDNYIEVSTQANSDGYSFLTLGDKTVTDRKLFKFEYNSANHGLFIIPKYNQSLAICVSGASVEVGQEFLACPQSVSDNYIFIAEKVSNSITSSATYQDNGNYIHTVTDSRGNTTTYNYDTQRGTLLGVQDAMGNTVSYSYNQLNDRLNSVTSGQSTVSYEYETNGGIKKITSPSGTQYNFTYDEFGRNVGISVGSENLSTTTYESEHSSLVKEFEYGNNVKKEYTYDDQDRLVSESVRGIEKVRYIYDKRSNVAQVNDYYVNVTTKFSYDLIGRIIGITSTDGQKLSYNYDALNRLKMSKWSLNNISLSSEYIYGDTAVLGQKAGLIYGVKTNGIEDLRYVYDELCRIKTRTLETTTPYVTQYGYLEGEGIGTTTTLIKTVKNGNDTLEYAYDELGNITSVKKNNVVIESYTYDSLNQLTGATYGGDTYAYTYDNGGNILSVSKNGTVIKNYGYNYANWKDLLTNFNGYTITYDTIGNPLQYRDGMNFTWANGRQLSTVTNGANSYSYTYNADGLRTAKTVNGVTTNYYWSNGILQAQKTGDEYLIFLYDENGSAYGFLLKNGTTQQKYYYLFNAQGDVIGIIDSNGTKVVEYTYGAWGDILSVTGTLASTIGQTNPIRYRGYYYDVETGFYYLQTRYYDPETCRFINADGAYDTNQGILGYNMYIYCLNNPTNMYDPDGTCSRFLGFLWKIDCKQASCSTSKNYIKPKAINPIGTYNNGQGYVYVLKESQLDIMEEREKNVVVIVDKRTDSDPNMQIQDSYRITKTKRQKEIAQLMLNYNTANPVSPAWNRTLDSLVKEWKIHNNVYKTGLFQINTADCDFNNGDEGKGYWDFFVERALK